MSDESEAKNVFGTYFFISGWTSFTICRTSGFVFSEVIFGFAGLNGDSESESDLSEISWALPGEDSSSEYVFAVLLGLTGLGGDSSSESDSSAGMSIPSGTIHESSKSDSRILTLPPSSSSSSSEAESDSPRVRMFHKIRNSWLRDEHDLKSHVTFWGLSETTTDSWFVI